MRFSVVNVGYDQGQVDSCLHELGEHLTRVAAQAEAAAGAGTGMGAVREEIDRLRGLLGAGPSPSRRPARGARPATVADAEAEAAEILAQARDELTAAREEARLVRDQVYAEALRARREFEASLHARRLREQQVDEILREVAIVRVPDEVTPDGAAPGVPATRTAAGGEAELAPPVEQPAGPVDEGNRAPVR